MSRPVPARPTALALLAALALGVALAQKSSAPPPPKAQAGVAQGRVLDAAGRPLAGVSVVLDNTVYANSGQTATTDAGGRYAFRLTGGAWRVYAKLTRAYHGRTYTFSLHPNTYDSFTSQTGGVRDFVWRLRGAQPAPGVGTYGGLVYIHRDPLTEFYDTENVRFTLAPAGPLVDGSAGQTIVTRHGAPRTDTFSQIPDVPIGRYTISGVHLPTGRPVVFRLTGQGRYTERLTFDFEPELNYCRNCVAIEVTLPGKAPGAAPGTASETEPAEPDAVFGTDLDEPLADEPAEEEPAEEEPGEDAGH